MALTTVAVVKLACGITDSSEDDYLTQLVGQVDSTVKRWLDRDIESASYVEYLQGRWKRVLQLRHYPVTALASIYLDTDGYWGQGTDAFAAADLLTSGTDYALIKDGTLPGAPTVPVAMTGRVLRLGGSWPGTRSRDLDNLASEYTPGLGNIKASYTAGYTTVPTDLQLAATLIVQRIRLAGQAGQQMTSESIIDYSYSLGQAGKSSPDGDTVAWSIGGTLRRYRRVP